MHTIAIKFEDVNYHFEVGEYPDATQPRCKYNVLYQQKLVATFTPGRDHILHLCQNYGNLNEQLLHSIADEIEKLHLYGFFEY